MKIGGTGRIDIAAMMLGERTPITTLAFGSGTRAEDMDATLSAPFSDGGASPRLAAVTWVGPRTYELRTTVTATRTITITEYALLTDDNEPVARHLMVPPVQLATGESYVFAPRVVVDIGEGLSGLPTGIVRDGLVAWYRFDQFSTNRLSYPTLFDAAAWDKTGVDVVPNAAVAPDGSVGADLILENEWSDTHYLAQDAPVNASSRCTASVYLKRESRGIGRVSVGGDVVLAWAFFDLSVGAMTAFGGGIASIDDAGNGWWRCSVSFDTQTDTSVCVGIGLASGWTCPDDCYESAGLGLYAWGAQLEHGPVASSFVETNVLTDLSGNGLHGQIGSVSGEDSADPVWSVPGLVFSGGQVVDCGLDTDLNVGNGDFTITAACIPTSATATQAVFGKLAFYLNEWGLAQYAGKLYLAFRGAGNGLIVAADATYTAGQAYVVTGRRRGTALNLFVDGVQQAAVGAVTEEPDTAARPFRIGELATTGGFFNGTVLYGLVYNRGLAAWEERQNHAAIAADLAVRGVVLT